MEHVNAIEILAGAALLIVLFGIGLVKAKLASRAHR